MTGTSDQVIQVPSEGPLKLLNITVNIFITTAVNTKPGCAICHTAAVTGESIFVSLILLDFFH